MGRPKRTVADHMKVFGVYREDISYYFDESVYLTGREIRNLVALTSLLGVEVAKRYVHACIENWEEIRDEFAITGTYPTINVLYAWRDAFSDYLNISGVLSGKDKRENKKVCITKTQQKNGEITSSEITNLFFDI